ncbi:MAG: hypothetical protein PHX62_03885 [Bacilli bacterium]|nr:hypothetical protein [Bacilli bacterium]
MKKILIIFCLVLILPFSLPLKGASGHESFSAINLKGEGKLLAEMTEAEFNAGYEAMGKRKFWGWKHHYFLIREEAIYFGEVIFAKSNRTNQNIEVNYVLQEKEYDESSWKITGSISGKIKGKLKIGDLEGGAEFEGEKEEMGSYTRFEETKFKVTIEPNHRMVFQVTGECLVSNGVSKHYIFGITSKQGAWEYVDVLTSYYELYETEILE